MENTPLVWLVGDSARARLLSVLVDEHRHEISATELGRQTELSKAVVDAHIKELLRADLVEQTQQSGSNRWYRLNTDTDLAELLCELDNLALQTLLNANRDPVTDLSDELIQHPAEMASSPALDHGIE